MDGLLYGRKPEICEKQGLESCTRTLPELEGDDDEARGLMDFLSSRCTDRCSAKALPEHAVAGEIQVAREGVFLLSGRAS